MIPFNHSLLASAPVERAPDGSQVKVLLGVVGGRMVHFELSAGQVSRAVVHKTVEEIWYVLSGSGQMWRKQEDREGLTALEPGTCLTLPLGTHFQFRASESGPLSIIAVTIPPWPGSDEALVVPGPWEETAQ